MILGTNLRIEYPPNYNGMVFEGCYHCGDRKSTTRKKWWMLDGLEKQGKGMDIYMIIGISIAGAIILGGFSKGEA